MTEGAGTRRAVCARCRRPEVVCYCQHLPNLQTRTKILLLQHPRERHVAIGTARMAHLALPNSTFRTGVDFSNDRVVREMVAPEHDAGPVCVLFPRPGAIEVASLPRDRAVTLVVLDGTWSLARKLLTLNPFLRALPHVAFTPSGPSDYRIRRQPAPFCVSTIEALAEVLRILEPGGTSFEALLDPFRAMVAQQEGFIRDVHARRHLGGRRKPVAPGRPSLGERLRGEWSRIVCVQGEANAWPRRDPERRAPEIIHWVAHRVSTGERYEAIVAPRNPLARATLRHALLDETDVAGGISLESWRRTWSEFSRPDDLLVFWGMFYLALGGSDGLSLTENRLDLRKELAHLRQGRFKTVDDALAHHTANAEGVGEPPCQVGARGRAGRRLAALVRLVETVAVVGAADGPPRAPP